MRSLCFALAAFSSAAIGHTLPHFDPEMTGPEYQRVWHELTEKGHKPAFLHDDEDPLLGILAYGNRNLDWLAAINAQRSPSERLELYTPDNTQATPITSYRTSNRALILAHHAKVLAEVPAAMHDILSGSGALPDHPMLDDAGFLAASRRIDASYQAASRWLLQEPHLAQYKVNAQRDIRSYYALDRIDKLWETLQAWAELTEDERAFFRTHLVGICHNSGKAKAACLDELTMTITKNGNPTSYLDTYWWQASWVYDGYFKIRNPRLDVDYSRARQPAFILPFTRPAEGNVERWLSENIEDEWRFGAFQLHLRMEGAAPWRARVVFTPGATPHVNGLGGNVITMDANRDIDGYLERWTIRHELGHVLGFPDCYVEFYDSDVEAMIYYQIDTEDLMCSRRGHIKARHIEAIDRAYFSRLQRP